jgi:hypothetical protein
MPSDAGGTMSTAQLVITWALVTAAALTFVGILIWVARKPPR